jgi:hypothetical protein
MSRVKRIRAHGRFPVWESIPGLPIVDQPADRHASKSDILGNPAWQGFVELDGVCYDFILNPACQKTFGAVHSAGPPADGSDGSVDSIIPPEGLKTDTAAEWDPPSVEIDIGADSWTARAGWEHLVGGASVSLSLRRFLPGPSSLAALAGDRFGGWGGSVLPPAGRADVSTDVGRGLRSSRARSWLRPAL